MSSVGRMVNLPNNVRMPLMGLGTWQVKDAKLIYELVDEALRVGYRFIDTARAYGNESAIGAALQNLLPKHGLTRQDLFITSKLPPVEQGDALRCVDESLANLQTDYIDLYLIHWPGAANMKPDDERHAHKRKLSWEQLEECFDAKKLRAIGVSNYEISHLDQLVAHARIQPAVNQCEFHPHFANMKLVDHCTKLGIHFQAYSTFGSPAAGSSLFEESIVKDIASRHDCTPSQVLLAWPMQLGISVLPRTTKIDRVKQNFDSSSIELRAEDLSEMSSLASTKHKYCWDPSVIR